VGEERRGRGCEGEELIELIMGLRDVDATAPN
jgi:hypothetical protein